MNVSLRYIPTREYFPVDSSSFFTHCELFYSQVFSYAMWVFIYILYTLRYHM